MDLRKQWFKDERLDQAGKTAAKWMGVGALALVGGATAGVDGVREGYAIAIGGGAAYTIGAYSLIGCAFLDCAVNETDNTFRQPSEVVEAEVEANKVEID